ncbi:MAG: GGDEF domain-containing phosphodiesterase [Methylobacter sp.]|uniref:EAL domain-containing protein n=1 Tax=Methylobacter sp. TaxID=2051955 RepID=UPI00258565C9|nr:GGDEF domain-containing phosphodiesterase [Methylobacter sp.]MCL7419740.1 GGDEF domain-containing phosphodiesterase [Methylobacter sp.]
MPNEQRPLEIFPRAGFIDLLKHYCQENEHPSVLALVEINNAFQVARLIQGMDAEEQLITTVERLIISSLSVHDCAFAGKTQNHQYGIVLNHASKEAREIFEALAQALDKLEVDIAGKTYYPKVMIGIAPLTPEFRSAELALSVAEEALYQARRIGNSIVNLLAPDDVRLHRYLDCLKLLPELRAGLLKKAFVFYAQPIVSITGQGAVPKAEVLLRYKASDGRILPSAGYLQTAALFNVSREVDLYALEHCCRFFKEKPSNTVYSINISGATVRYPFFFESVKERIHYYGLDPSQICFEITENVADQDYDRASLLMFKLKNELGCKLSLDDIGIGSSNLANLPKYDVDYMKIDGSFVQTLLSQPYAELIVRFIDTAAKLHHKQTIAEYVEQPVQLKKLQEIGVDFSQGCLTGRPEMLFNPSEL